ncbi:hypothetical protein [Umezawaea sp. Da 62-37]|uniref:hypothetical protein n=1 Tax=Umezawaea sp. Da 62-37 TaxID=3075927 RepID=UPI0028F6D6CE|nr:hypothetical protein [Umezawaea sp. Da 62-37]WNV85060.1 hypothetical protein RM788_44095 [Umezawaea sp. Da 62-37]
MRIFQRGDHALHLWFTSSYSLAAANLSSRGPLYETFDVKAAITSHDTPGTLTVPFRQPNRKDTPAAADLTWEQAGSFLRTYGFTLASTDPCDDNGVPTLGSGGSVKIHSWVKHDPRHPAPLRVRLYGSPDDQPIAWYWAGRIRSLQQFGRICTR